MTWRTKILNAIKRRFNRFDIKKMFDKEKLELCACCFQGYAKDFAVDYDGVWLRASNLKHACGVASTYHNLIRLNRSCLEGPKNHIETVDVTLSHELEHMTIFKIMLSLGFDEKTSDIGCLCVSEPSSGDMKTLRKKMAWKK
jgi:hypothetical protein